MVKNTLILFCVIIVIMIPIAPRGQHKPNKQKMTGRVIARDAYLGLARLSSPASVEVFIVRVNEGRREKTSSRFIKVRYEDYEAKEPLPSGLLDGKLLWRFSLSRAQNCDQTVSQGLFVAPSKSATPPPSGAYVLLENAGVDLPKVGSFLQCFAVQPGGIKPQKSLYKETVRTLSLLPTL